MKYDIQSTLWVVQEMLKMCSQVTEDIKGNGTGNRNK